jgi:predicted enzyme related to lactoylglutathione lyase
VASFVRNVSFDSADPYALAGFWSGVLAHPIHPSCSPGDEEVVIEPAGGPRFFFQAVPEPKTIKNRVHVCLSPSSGDRDTEVDRLLTLGATISGDFRTASDSGWVVLQDPEGNEFCLTVRRG